MMEEKLKKYVCGSLDRRLILVYGSALLSSSDYFVLTKQFYLPFVRANTFAIYHSSTRMTLF